MADSNEGDELSQFLNLPPPTSFSLASIHDHILNPPTQPLIFPPNNHENLHVTPSSDTSSSFSSSSYPSSSWDDSSPPSSPIDNFRYPSGVSNLGSESLTKKVNEVPNLELGSESLTKKVNGVPDWGRWNLEALTRKVNGVVVFVKKFRVVRSVLLILRSPVGQLLALLLYLRWQKRRRRRWTVGVGSSDGRNHHLVRVIREKDERIEELLNQIARMNEVLLSMHKVPSSKTG